jgi:MinD superfamily P-loop ATPase
MLIAVASGKGGTGKTIFSTALALSVPACVYADLDVEEPNGAVFLKPEIEREMPFHLPVPRIDNGVCTFCQKCADACVYNAIAIIPPVPKAVIFDELCHACGVCGYVCPVEGALKEIGREIGRIRSGHGGQVIFVEGRLHIGIPSAVPLIAQVVEESLKLAPLVIADSSPGTSCNMVESVKRSDYIILVTEPTPFGLHDLELAVTVARDLGKPCGIVINKSSDQDNLIERYARQANLPVLLKIPYRLDIQQAYSEGIPLIEVMPELKGRLGQLYRQIGKGI